MSRRFAERHYDNKEAVAAAGAKAAASGTAASSGSSSVLRSALPVLQRGLTEMVQQVVTDYSATSRLAEARDSFAYEGVAGAAYMALHVEHALASTATAERSGAGSSSSSNEDPQQQLALLATSLPKVALQYSEHAAELVKQYVTARRGHKAVPLTFFCGTGGVWATVAMAALRQGKTAEVEAAAKALMAGFSTTSEDAGMPNEILYGRAGYLHSLLLVHHVLSKRGDSPLLKPLQACIDSLFDQIVFRGAQFKPKPKEAPLMWAWHDKLYLGAAHGVTGILYELMSVPWRWTREAAEAAAPVRKLVEGTLNYCLSLRLESGNFPSSDSTDPDYDPQDKLIQWCHGAPGLALACIKAYELWRDDRYLVAARELAEVVWQRGLLKKGVGLCHGIGGNAYVFLRLYEASHDSVQLERAVSFARFALEGPHRDELLQEPDAPSSLGNGRAGFACFLADLVALVSSTTGATAAATSAPADAGAAAAGGENERKTTTTTITSAQHHRVSFPGMDVL